MDYVGMVREFHTKMGIFMPDEIRDALPAGIRLKRIRLMTEEVGELVIAMDQRDIINIADAACDLIYVIAGTALSYGFRELAHGNYQNHIEGRGLYSNILDSDDALELIELLTIKLAGVNSGLSRNSLPPNTILDELSGFIRVVFEIAQRYGLPLDRCFTEVHRSNMTKTPLDEFAKGGKGPGFTPPDLHSVIFASQPNH